MKGKLKDEYGSRTSMVLSLCSREEGACMEEMKAKLERTATAVCNLTHPLMQRGQLFKVGHWPHTRYFTNPEGAKVYEEKLPEILRIHKEKDHQKRLARQRAYESEKRAKRGTRVRNRAKPASPRADALRQTKEWTPPAKPVAPVITWPDNVKVTKAPTPKDSRFTFDPPPGWKGQITRDWMDRRLQEMGKA